ncbi:MAG: hypothetical protein IPL78_11390 [Chloroflexi bacterium]|nr:hypothetical protein [Chloroflexota bacterium]
MNNLTAEPTIVATVNGAIFSLILDPIGEQIVAGSVDGRILIWSLADPTAEPTVLARHSDRAKSWPFARWQVLASAGEDRAIFLWEWAIRRLSRCFWQGIKPGYGGWPSPRMAHS